MPDGEHAPEEEPTCFFCNVEVNEKEYCYGCGEYVCNDCAINYDLPFGGHLVEQHRQDPEEEDEDY